MTYQRDDYPARQKAESLTTMDEFNANDIVVAILFLTGVVMFGLCVWVEAIAGITLGALLSGYALGLYADRARD